MPLPPVLMGPRCTSRLLLALLIVLPACSGGGPASSALLLEIRLEGVARPIWTGVDADPPACSGIGFQNGGVGFLFDGPVDPGSLAASTLRVEDELAGPVAGHLFVADEPSLPAGNSRRVLFVPAIGAVGPGFRAGSSIRAIVPAGALLVGGRPLQNSARTCFSVCAPGAMSCAADLVPGAPFVIATEPPSSPAPPGDLVAGPTGADDRIAVSFSEDLDPAGLGLGALRFVNVASGVAVPGTLEHHPRGSPEAGALGPRLVFEPAIALSAGATYRIELGPGLVDFGGHAARLYDPALGLPPSTERRLGFLPAPLQPRDFVESFDSPNHRATSSQFAIWTDLGRFTIQAVEELLGSGSGGPLVVPPGSTLVLDTGTTALVGPGGQATPGAGVFDVQSLHVQPGSTLRIMGPRPAVLRSIGPVLVEGRILLGAGTDPSAPPGTAEQGPQPGSPNQGSGTPTAGVVLGGQGGPGGGRGGRASQDPGRTVVGEAGFGTSVDGQPGSDPGHPAFGGGEGGRGAGFSGMTGALGGAGGSAFTSGAAGQPAAFATCTPLPVPAGTLALPTGTVPAFAPPVAGIAAGSGGGGGGDHHDPFLVSGDDQGGGGGGGGGGLLVTAPSVVVSGEIRADGAPGAVGAVLAGGGGGGAGGLVWIRSLDLLSVSVTAALTASGGAGAFPCSPFASGPGGAGLLQLESGDGLINTAFTGPIPGPPSNLVVLRNGSGAGILAATATSIFFDTGSLDPVYDLMDADLDPGTAPGATLQVRVQGARPDPASGGPDLLALSPWLDAASVGQLTGGGYRHFRFRLDASYAFSGVVPGTALPAVLEVRVHVRVP
jgi:hypothetical protein